VKLTLDIDKPVYGGDCLAHWNEAASKSGKAIFVPFALPGETVSAHVVEDKRNHASAELDEVLTTSPHRVEPRCPYFGTCGGCHYQHADYPTQLAMKEQVLRETLSRARVPFPKEIKVLAGDPWGYRNRIRLALTADGGVGYRSRRSHDIVPIAECPIAAPILVQSAVEIAALLRDKAAPVQVKEMELFTNPGETEMLLTLFCGQAASEAFVDWLAQVQQALPVPRSGVTLRGPTSSLSTGTGNLEYHARGFAYRVAQRAFFQVNRWLVEDFVSLVTEGRAGKRAWDLYAGVGLFARPLADQFEEVVAVESAPESTASLRHNLAGIRAEAIPATTLNYLRRNREQREPRPDLIVLDPPRAGLGEEVTTLLNQIQAPEMVYVSCDPATLARDLRALTQERYSIESITLADMFPQTFHIETVVMLRRG
jgi:23S rRNA (uracil1939-C5)-methyltransferase